MFFKYCLQRFFGTNTSLALICVTWDMYKLFSLSIVIILIFCIYCVKHNLLLSNKNQFISINNSIFLENPADAKFVSEIYSVA